MVILGNKHTSYITQIVVILKNKEKEAVNSNTVSSSGLDHVSQRMHSEIKENITSVCDNRFISSQSIPVLDR